MIGWFRKGGAKLNPMVFLRNSFFSMNGFVGKFYELYLIFAL